MMALAPWLRYVLAFGVMVVLDATWAAYVRFAAERMPVRAGLSSMAIYAMGSALTLTYVEDHWTIVPAMLGGFVGTYLAVRKA
jgi:hypothetical protein